VDPIPENTNSSTDVTNHKRATPKTSLLSRAVCCSRILFSICNLISICIDAHPLESVTAAARKRKINCFEQAQNSFCSQNKSRKPYAKKSAQKYLQKIAASISGSRLQQRFMV
jgi:acetylglutamate synthase